MANADGGELVIGMENNGDITGLPHSPDKLRLISDAPKLKNYVDPPLPCRSHTLSDADGATLLHFIVDWSPSVHQLSNGRYLLRVRDRNEPFPYEKITALKSAKQQGLVERTFPPGATLDDLDMDAADSLLKNIRPGQSSQDFFLQLGLTERRNGHHVPTLAALLLFARDPQRWHDRCGIDFVRWEGKDRRHGSELNISKRFAITAPLAVLIAKAREAIAPFIREPQKLHDLFFSEQWEYPTFVWQEALVNAVAHRDYSIRGLGIEVWMFDDHMEIRSPGLPPSPVTIEALEHRQYMHCSRNPLIVRVLTALGYMRELGEGIPRMFEEMERAGRHPPKLSIVGSGVFQVTLRNEPIYDEKMVEWLTRFKDVDLNSEQKRILAYAHAHDDRFTSRDFQKVIGTDIYGASIAIKDMVRKGVTKATGKGGRLYLIQRPLTALPGMPADLQLLLPVLRRKGGISNADLTKKARIARITATRILREWAAAGWLIMPKKRGRGAIYTPGPGLLHQPYIASQPSQTDAIHIGDDAIKKG